LSWQPAWEKEKEEEEEEEEEKKGRGGAQTALRARESDAGGRLPPCSSLPLQPSTKVPLPTRAATGARVEWQPPEPSEFEWHPSPNIAPQRNWCPSLE